MPKFILSPCHGTSLLIKQASDIERKLIDRYANTQNEHEVPTADLQQLEDLIDRVEQKIVDAVDDHELVAHMSGELDNILQLYDGRIAACQDYHVLICDDTWLKKTAASCVALWLKNRGLTAEVRPQVDTDPANVGLHAAQIAILELIEWCELTLPRYQQAGYQVIFNLPGSFRSEPGTLQLLSAYYADETTYFFENRRSLLRIPGRLGSMDYEREQIIREHLDVFRRLAMRLPTITTNLPETIYPPTLLMKYDEATLSPWGRIVWNEARKFIYKDKVHPSPSTKLIFGEKFEQSIYGITPEQTISVNKRIDQLAKYLETKGEYNPSSLDFKQLENDPCPPSTHEIDAWSDGDAKRIFGHYEESIFILDKLDRALHWL